MYYHSKKQRKKKKRRRESTISWVIQSTTESDNLLWHLEFPHCGWWRWCPFHPSCQFFEDGGHTGPATAPGDHVKVLHCFLREESSHQEVEEVGVGATHHLQALSQNSLLLLLAQLCCFQKWQQLLLLLFKVLLTMLLIIFKIQKEKKFPAIFTGLVLVLRFNNCGPHAEWWIRPLRVRNFKGWYRIVRISRT